MRFQPGNSASPGRPPGTGDQAKKARRIIGQHLPQLVETRLAAALNGDEKAADVLISFYATTTPAST
jgi:hypothetical protein